jgi:hypothetical protein
MVHSCSLVLAAATLGFLVWNYPRGQIMLGDGGAYFLGFMLGALSILIVARNPGVSAWFPVLLLAYPLVEVSFTVYRRRVLRDAHPHLPDAAHLHQLIFRRPCGSIAPTSTAPAFGLFVLTYVWLLPHRAAEGAAMDGAVEALTMPVVIGDLQGCLPCLRLLAKVERDAPGALLWFVGDLVNRGPPAETLRFVRSLGDRAVSVLATTCTCSRWPGHPAAHRSDTLDDILAAPIAPELLTGCYLPPAHFEHGHLMVRPACCRFGMPSTCEPPWTRFTWPWADGSAGFLEDYVRQRTGCLG